jgi:hypothetical protein
MGRFHFLRIPADSDQTIPNDSNRDSGMILIIAETVTTMPAPGTFSAAS